MLFTKKSAIPLFFSIIGIFLFSTIAIAAENLTCCAINVEPRTGPAVLPVQCQINFQGGTPPCTYSWDFDDSDGIQVDKYHADPSFVYGFPGKYVITATVKDRMGVSATDTVHVTVLPGNFVQSQPLELNDIHGTKAKPYVVDGLEISNPNGCGIRMEFCSNIVVRNCWLHHNTHPDSLNQGMIDAILIAKSSNVIIENCLVTNNARGILSDAWDGYRYNYNITVRNCVVENSSLEHGIHIKNTDGVQITNNVLRDNGDPDFFESNRITGIICWASHNIHIHDNFVTGSSSDGIAVAADNMLIGGEDPEFVTQNFSISRNTSRKNGEQGIWFTVAANGDVCDNYINNNVKSGICLEYKIFSSKIHHNFIKNDSLPGIFVNQSFNNLIYENTITEPVAAFGAICVHSMKQLKIHFDYPVRGNNNLIKNNIIYNSIHGILVSDGDSTYIVNNTIYSCGPYYVNEQAGITIDSLAGYTVIKNNIISDNTGFGITCFNEQSEISYNNVWNNRDGNYLNCQAGNGDISVEPMFESAEMLNFFLKEKSLCIDAGDPLDEFANEPEPDGGRINMGAYGNTQYAGINQATMVKNRITIPSHIQLKGNYPNPFNSQTIITYQLKANTHVKLAIFNALGQKISTLVNKKQQLGQYHIQWNGTDEFGNSVASGSYICRLEANKTSIFKKILLLR